MSTYINPSKSNTLRIDKLDAPPFLKEFLNHELVIRNMAPRTVNSYYLHIRSFLRWLKMRNSSMDTSAFEEIKISDVTLPQALSITKSDVFEYLSFLSSVLENGPETRSVKLTALKSLYGYFRDNDLVAENPAEKIKTPKREQRLPKYLSEDESIQLLSSVDGDMVERDYCMLVFFLNCGMRISELVSINISHIKKDVLKIYGKGRKERVVYLNDACLAALDEYLDVRDCFPLIRDEDALWISPRTGKRLTSRRIQQIVERCLKQAGLDDKGYSPHKLRHTTATLLYKEGADILEIKELLGHRSTATTEIYTHLDEQQLREVAKKSPLAHERRKTKKN